jgi:hypothetical protein
VNSKPEREIIPEEEINLYDYWKVFVKRKKVFIGIFLVPLVIVTIIGLSLPRYYRGESEISIPASPASNIPSVRTAPNIVRLIGNIDDSQKAEIFTNNPDAIESVLISLPKISTDKVNISIDAKTADIIPQAFSDLLYYINNLPGIKEELARIQRETDLKTEKNIEQTDLKIKYLIEVRKANLIFLNDLSDVIKKRKSSFVNINPADLIRKDGDLSLEIMNLQQEKTAMMKAKELKELNVKINVGILGQISITKHPSNSRIKQIIMITGLLSLFTGIFVIILLEYIDRMKAREK